jgi:hypothetical protein
VDQTSARIFYAVTLAENLIIFGADVSNAFAEAPPPKQGFYICQIKHSAIGGSITRSVTQFPLEL